MSTPDTERHLNGVWVNEKRDGLWQAIRWSLANDSLTQPVPSSETGATNVVICLTLGRPARQKHPHPVNLNEEKPSQFREGAMAGKYRMIMGVVRPDMQCKEGPIQALTIGESARNVRGRSG
jgi:hypothetical protein